MQQNRSGLNTSRDIISANLVHFTYLDETGDQDSIGFSALSVPVLNYRDSLTALKQCRRDLKASDGIYTTTELHACKFTSGRGKLKKKGRGVSQHRRCEIFNSMLRCVAQLPNVSLLNAFRMGTPKDNREQLLERLINRIQTDMEKSGSQTILFFDEGSNKWITKVCRRLAVYNMIRSRMGAWPDGKPYKNFPTINILEDPVFRSSRTSYMIQAVDFCAYALFQKEKPTPSRREFGLDKSFEELLLPICNTNAAPRDPHGIIR